MKNSGIRKSLHARIDELEKATAHAPSAPELVPLRIESGEIIMVNIGPADEVMRRAVAGINIADAHE